VWYACTIKAINEDAKQIYVGMGLCVSVMSQSVYRCMYMLALCVPERIMHAV